MEHFIEILIHALKDSAPLLPWILLIYIVIELLQSKADLTKVNGFGGKLGPVVGAATGLIPQCGFSIMAAKLFEQKYITVGTLLAIFFATSDEAFIIMLSSGEGAVWVLPMLAAKVLIGVLVGYMADGVISLIGHRQVCLEMQNSYVKNPNTTHEIFMRAYLEEKDVEVRCSCGRTHDETRPFMNYFVYPLLHTLQVAAFIFLVNVLLTWIIHEVGEEVFAQFMQKNRFAQPFIACAIGLIPNCASSVVLTETFLSGGIAFGSCLAGLCSNAGMGFVVLLRNTRQWKRNLALIAVCYILPVIVGLIVNCVPIGI